MNQETINNVFKLAKLTRQIKLLVATLRTEDVDLGSIHIELNEEEATVIVFNMTLEEFCENLKVDAPVIVENVFRDALFRSVTINGLTFQEIITSKGE